jgi:hypothetical protein
MGYLIPTERSGVTELPKSNGFNGNRQQGQQRFFERRRLKWYLFFKCSVYELIHGLSRVDNRPGRRKYILLETPSRTLGVTGGTYGSKTRLVYLKFEITDWFSRSIKVPYHGWMQVETNDHVSCTQRAISREYQR